MSRKYVTALWTAAAILLAALFLTGCITAKEPQQVSGYYFNTLVTLTAYGKNADAVLEEGLALCAQYENLLSFTKEGSDIWKINHANGQPVQVHPDTAFLLNTALSYAEMTDGLIDPTVTPLSMLWNFSGNPPGPVPDSAQIQAVLPHVNYRYVHVRDCTVFLEDPDARIDLGFLAKGYIADRLKELFLEHKINHGLINLGGNVVAVGSKPGNRPFRTGIRKPFGTRGQTVAIVALSDKSLVTSGSYERCFIQDGILYHHILDPSTGYPAQTDLDSVTILSSSSMEGDALSTACFLLGQKKGQELIESLPDAEALFITKDQKIHKTGGFLDSPKAAG